MRKQAFVFDVDGTLTKSRCEIDKNHKDLWSKFCERFSVYVVTGSDRAKTQEQMLGLQDLALGVYQCGGNNYWQNGKELYDTPFILDDDMHDHLKFTLKSSPYINKTGKHIEIRKGMINFSIVGRNADMDERETYKKYDELVQQRFNISSEFNELFDDYVSYVAGDTGIDIFMKNKHKGQVYKALCKHYDITYFGDKCEQGGNDYPFAELMTPNDTLHSVKSPEETFALMEKYFESV